MDVTDSTLLFSQPYNHEQPIKWMHASGGSTLIVDPLSGDMRIRGSDLDISKVKQFRVSLPPPPASGPGSTGSSFDEWLALA